MTCNVRVWLWSSFYNDAVGVGVVQVDADGARGSGRMKTSKAWRRGPRGRESRPWQTSLSSSYQQVYVTVVRR